MLMIVAGGIVLGAVALVVLFGTPLWISVLFGALGGLAAAVVGVAGAFALRIFVPSLSAGFMEGYGIVCILAIGGGVLGGLWLSSEAWRDWLHEIGL